VTIISHAIYTEKKSVKSYAFRSGLFVYGKVEEIIWPVFAMPRNASAVVGPLAVPMCLSVSVCHKSVFYENWHLKFRYSKSIVSSSKLVDGRTCWPHLRPSTRRVLDDQCCTLTAHKVYCLELTKFTTRPSTATLSNSITSIVLDLLHKFFLQLCSS